MLVIGIALAVIGAVIFGAYLGWLMEPAIGHRATREYLHGLSAPTWITPMPTQEAEIRRIVREEIDKGKEQA